MSERSGRVLSRLLPALKLAFLALIAWFIWRGFRGHGDELRAALDGTPAVGPVVSLALVLAGLLATAQVWRRALATFGHLVSLRPALRIFFVGQLGKYIPGSVWTFGAQAVGGRTYDVPARTTVAASLMFLGVHVATAGVVGGAIGLVGPSDLPIGRRLGAVILIGSLLSLAPGLVRRSAKLVAGVEPELTGHDVLGLIAGMGVAWSAYALSIVALRPSAGLGDLASLVAAYALAYAAGVLVFLAPAGLGAREGVFVLLATPAVGIGTAGTVALLTRLVGSVGDVLAAVAANMIAKRDARQVDSVQPE